MQFPAATAGGDRRSVHCRRHPTAVIAGHVPRRPRPPRTRRPDLVAADDWRQAIEDGRQFLARWGEQAAALGWTADDLFGLHDAPEQLGRPTDASAATTAWG